MNKNRRAEGKWGWVPDLLLSIPELIVYGVKMLIRGFLLLLKIWN